MQPTQSEAIHTCAGCGAAASIAAYGLWWCEPCADTETHVRAQAPEVISPEQQLRNVAASVQKVTEWRGSNGRGRPNRYAGRVDAIASAAAQLAGMVLAYLDGELTAMEYNEETPF